LTFFDNKMYLSLMSWKTWNTIQN